MAVPKRKISRQRQKKRRSQQRLKLPKLILCPNCGQQKRPHTVCPHCGYYKDKPVLAIRAGKK